MQKIRSPVIATVGHVDHGKTTLLDCIRGTTVAEGEAGLITQHIGATKIPTETIKMVCGNLLKKINIEIEIPGLLIIDTPGHAAFTTLRKRGGAVADLAILVVDVNEGFQPQTDESLNFLKHFKTPFIVAATKIDRIVGWRPEKNSCFLESFRNQSDRTQDELEEKIYRIIGQLSTRGFSSERIDRISDFTKQVAIVPVSGVTGEGIPDLLMALIGIAQKYLKGRLEIKPGEGKGTVLEVKDFKGLGTTIDVILYDGEINKGDYIVIGSTHKEKIITTRVKALLEPEPLKEMRIEKKFRYLDSVTAAAGIKILAPDLDQVVAGMPLRAVRDAKSIENVKKEVISEMEEVEIETDRQGVILFADTLGSLEALIKTLKEIDVQIRKATIGKIAKADIMEVRVLPEPIVFAFGVKPCDEIIKMAKDNNIALFKSDVIYTLIEDYQKWKQEKKKFSEEEILAKTTRPGQIKVLPGYVFRQKNPAVFGIEVLKGMIKPGYRLKKDSSLVGEIKEIQSKGENLQEAKSGERVALSVQGVVIGKDIKEGDVLENYLTGRDKENLVRVRNKLGSDELEMLGL
jgi:translation initiation factor 5B